MPAGERDEDVFQGGGMGAELGQLGALPAQLASRAGTARCSSSTWSR